MKGQMKVTNSSTACREKDHDQSKNACGPSCASQLLQKNRDMSKMIVMSGTAKRKPLENSSIKETIAKSDTFHRKTNFRQDIPKLRAPFCKPRTKHVQTEEKLMNKSCEILFECIKPYKDIVKNTKVQVMETNQTTKIPFKSGVIYQRTATRKVKFLSICPEQAASSFFQDNHSVFDILKNDSSEVENLGTGKVSSKGISKTISSEDFIKNAVSPISFQQQQTKVSLDNK